jgi:hypothetical protein
LFKLESIVDALMLLKPLGNLDLLSLLGARAKQNLQPLGLQQILSYFDYNLHFNCQELLIIYPYNIVVLAHLLGGFLASFGG